MSGPIDYSIGGIPDPSQALMQGLGQGMQLNQMQQARQQQQLQQQQAQQLNAELDAASRDPRLIPGLMVRYPQLAEKFKFGLEAMSAEQQKGVLTNNTEVASALASGKPEFAIKTLQRRQELLQTQGDTKGAAAIGQMIEDVRADPDAMLTFTLGRINALPGGDKVSKGILDLFEERRKAGLAPSVQRKADAEATTAEIAAKYGEQSALLDLTKKGWEVKHLMADIDFKRESNRIAAMNAAANREGNALKREELGLRIQEARQKLDDGVRTKAAEVEGARSSIDNLLNTADRILKVPGDTRRAALGTLDSRLPTVQQDVADFEELVAGLGSQTFIAQLPAMKGTGAISEKEGDKLQASLQNLSLRQSPEQFESNIREVQRLMLKARKNLTTRYGVPENVPDTPAAAPTASEVDALVSRYTGIGAANPPPRR